MKALIIDDDPWSRTLYARLLRRLDCEPVAVDGGAEALTCLERERPALVLLDLQMPGVDGREVLRAIRASSALANVPVVVVTATTDRERVVELIELGIAGYLVKQSGVEEALRRLELVVTYIRARSESAASDTASLDEPGSAGPASDEPAAVASGAVAPFAVDVTPDEIAAQATAPRAAAVRVLVADPDASYRAAACLGLEDAFDVSEVATGAAALRVAVSAPPDVVLVGETIDLPWAEALARRLRTFGRAMHVVLVTDLERAGVPAGFDAAVARSFVPARIRELVCSVSHAVPTSRGEQGRAAGSSTARP